MRVRVQKKGGAWLGVGEGVKKGRGLISKEWSLSLCVTHIQGEISSLSNRGFLWIIFSFSSGSWGSLLLPEGHLFHSKTSGPACVCLSASTALNIALIIYSPLIMVAIENQILWLSNQYHKEIFICEPLKEIQNENRNDQIMTLYYDWQRER